MVRNREQGTEEARLDRSRHRVQRKRKEREIVRERDNQARAYEMKSSERE